MRARWPEVSKMVSVNFPLMRFSLFQFFAHRVMWPTGRGPLREGGEGLEGPTSVKPYSLGPPTHRYERRRGVTLLETTCSFIKRLKIYSISPSKIKWD